jgi:hypothetical protein
MNLKRKKQVIWLAAVALSASFLAMGVGTAVNYTQIAETKLAVWGEATLRAAIFRASDGNISSIKLNVSVEITNPGPKGVSLWLLVLKTWIRDYPTEAGDNTGRIGSDGATIVQNETRLWAPVTALSIEVDADIPAKTTKVVSKEFDMGRQANESVFRFVEEISSFAKTRLALDDSQLEWERYARITMYVSGVPHDVSGYGTYLREVPIITRAMGTDLNPYGG